MTFLQERSPKSTFSTFKKGGAKLTFEKGGTQDSFLIYNIKEQNIKTKVVFMFSEKK